MNYICHSGGCEGSDMMWETIGEKYGVKTIAYSFYNHVQSSKGQKILSLAELKEGYDAVLVADKTLKRYPNRIAVRLPTEEKQQLKKLIQEKKFKNFSRS